MFPPLKSKNDPETNPPHLVGFHVSMFCHPSHLCLFCSAKCHAKKAGVPPPNPSRFALAYLPEWIVCAPPQRERALEGMLNPPQRHALACFKGQLREDFLRIRIFLSFSLYHGSQICIADKHSLVYFL